MIVFFNLIGLGFAILVLVISYGLLTVFPGLNGPPFWYIALGLLVIIDLAYRYFAVRPQLQPSGTGLKTDLGNHWLTSGRGGSLMFLPAWLFALVLPLLGMVLMRL